jgi:serine O-acetyltransferase
MENKLQINQVVDELMNQVGSSLSSHDNAEHLPMPDIEELSKVVNLLNKILYPLYFGDSCMNLGNLSNYLGVYIDQLIPVLREQIRRGLCFANRSKEETVNCQKLAIEITTAFIKKLPEIKKLLQTDVVATFNGDPAAKNKGEIIYCYPGIKALTHHRIAHELLLLGVPLIPRIISEMSHSATGIDIHPGARIGESFAIDHGTGVVIGETCRIGNNVKIYQGVTLGALSFPLDADGNPIKGIDRHPIIEDGVVIYSGATILGRITVGANSVIGGNVWLTHDVPPNSKILQRKPRENVLMDGAGI